MQHLWWQGVNGGVANATIHAAGGVVFLVGVPEAEIPLYNDIMRFIADDAVSALSIVDVSGRFHDELKILPVEHPLGAIAYGPLSDDARDWVAARNHALQVGFVAGAPAAPPPQDPTNDLKKLTLTQLRALAADIPGALDMKKSELIAAIAEVALRQVEEEAHDDQDYD